MRRGPEHKGFRYSYGRGRQSDCRCHHPRRGNNHRHHLRGQRPFRDRRSRPRVAGPKKVAIAGKTGVDIVLSEESQAIGDVIVVAYGTAKKESFTGSVAVVRAMN